MDNKTKNENAIFVICYFYLYKRGVFSFGTN